MPTSDPPLPWEIDVQSVQQWRAQNEPFLLLDCREPDEYALVHIEGSQLIPMQELPQRIAELEPFRQSRIVVHCHHGGRSLRVVHWLRQQGFPQAQNMTGGIDQWSLRVDPSLRRY